MIEDESYYWTVSRYIHLNPVRAGLTAHPAAWPWSSYPGYAKRSQRRPWVAYDALLTAYGGDYGGSDPAAAYRRFVEAGLSEPPPSPFREGFGGWVLGSDRFLARLRGLAGPVLADPAAPEARVLAGLSVEAILAAVAAYYELDSSALSCRRAAMEARAAAAWLCRRYTEVSMRELAPLLGLSRAGSVPNLTRWLEAQRHERPRVARDLDAIMRLVGPDGAGSQTEMTNGSGASSGSKHLRKHKT